MTIELDSSRWAIASESSYKAQCWDDEAVIYMRQTGDTHLLALSSFRILDIIGESNEVDSAFIAQRLEVKYSTNLSNEEINHCLQGLRQLALIKEAVA